MRAGRIMMGNDGDGDGNKMGMRVMSEEVR